MKNFLFIVGCPRSGTSALWKLISSHSRVALGNERFINRAGNKYLLRPSDFEKIRFFKIINGDSHYNTFPQLIAEYMKDLENRYENCIYFGDKIPILYHHYDQLFTTFKNIKILFIFRNIFDVAQSYKIRAINKKDNWEKTSFTAVSDWNKSLNETLRIFNSENILPIRYEDLWFNKFKYSRILDFLKLDYEETFNQEFKRLRIVANKREVERKNLLTSLEKKFIMDNMSYNSYRKLVEYFNSTFE